MSVFFTGTSAISSQSTFYDDHYLNEVIKYDSDYFPCLEPEYKEIINSPLLRRMTRIIKMGIAASMKSLSMAGVNNPEAILVGTGLGCLEDTERFLASMTADEQLPLSPTPFIQSTHNTIAGQLAIFLKCHSRSFTYSQRGHSFEHAMQDAIHQLNQGSSSVLVGGIDEVIPSSYQILQKLGCFSGVNEGEINRDRPVLGEGATFFTLSSRKDEKSMAELMAFETVYRFDPPEEKVEWLKSIVEKYRIGISDISGVLLGYNGSPENDKGFNEIRDRFFKNAPVFRFKNLSGEYFTAGAFGLHLALNMIRNQKVYPEIMIGNSPPSSINNLLIYNHFMNKYHTVIAIRKCQNFKP